MSRRYFSGVSGADSPPCLSVAGNHVLSAEDFSPLGRFAERFAAIDIKSRAANPGFFCFQEIGSVRYE